MRERFDSQFGNVEKKDDEKSVIKADGKESVIELRKKEKIADGHFCDIYKVDVSVKIKENESGEKTFAVKEFKRERSDYSGDNEIAGHSLKVYDALKKAGVSTWTTFRRVKDENSVLMTYGEKGNELLVSSSNASDSKDELRRLKAGLIENFENLVERAVKQAYSAGTKGIQIEGDAWMANFSPLPDKLPQASGIAKIVEYIKKPTPLKAVRLNDIFVGDFDNIGIFDGDRNYRSIALSNIESLKDFFDFLTTQVLPDDTAEKYWQKLKSLFNDTVDSLEFDEAQKTRWQRFFSEFERVKRRNYFDTL